ncbi:nitroreductase/quinone reductase family protein [Microbacterium sp. RURRCA19A]|uniref:nitroreductase/quinone reductase family protein n=1 Tax=Microbacterium sp. RURRCA19A TaxID=1907391 RepID=UPI00095552DA|nr:nitroreductase/quinone reductase family protein [Microbacterium sp. RURRCA19A]SIR65101.1 protein of unknown function [Microbacterium sp. RURRCA19A]
MDAAIATALSLTPSSTIEQRTVDITTLGARTQQPRRIEIWFHTIGGEVYITGAPPRARAWYANLLAHPEFTFHLKNGVHANLAALATPITDAGERSAVLGAILEGIDALYAGGASRPAFPPLEERVEGSPLVRVSFP